MGFETGMPGACREDGESVWIAWIVVVVDFFDFFLQCFEERNCKYELMSSSNMDGDNMDMTNRETWKAAYQGHNGGNNLREAQLYILAE
jgi:hypothetical protein